MITLKKTLIILAVFLALTALAGRYAITATEYTVSCGGLPSGLKGLRIVQLSDLHGSSFGKDNSRLVRRVAQAEPDMILLTGDMAGSEGELEAFRTLAEGISTLAPCYYVTGNHEYAGHCREQAAEIAGSLGITLLANEYTALELKGEQLIIAGADDPNGRADMIKPDELAEDIRAEYPDSFVILLGHRNYWVEKYPGLPVDLIFSGHAHGGIIRLPFAGGLINVDHSLGATYEAGVYDSGEYKMVVSRGLGNSVPVPRLFNIPEIVCVVLE